MDDTSPIYILETCARAMLPAALEGHVPPGRNGPHGDPETRIRNSSHWAIIFARLAEFGGDTNFLKASRALLSAILADDAVAAGRVPLFRQKEGKDQANGVIGLGWLIESLMLAGESAGVEEALAAARRLAILPPYDADAGLWKVRETDGGLVGHDPTMNHQIWFALGAALVGRYDSTIAAVVADFVGRLRENLSLTRTGELAHLIRPRVFGKPWVRQTVFSMLDRVPASMRHGILGQGPLRRLASQHRYVRSKEIGYLVFTLHGIARLDALHPLPPEAMGMVKTAVSRVLSESYRDEIECNIWAYTYNPPGFEFPAVAFSKLVGEQERGKAERLAAEFYRRQIQLDFDVEVARFGKVAPDAATATARIYPMSLLDPDQLDRLAVLAGSDD